MQRYALIEQGHPSILRIWNFRPSGGGRASESSASWSGQSHPASIVFSATGNAAAFVSDDAAANVICCLPDHPVLRPQQPISNEETLVAVSDDGSQLLTNNSQNQAQLVHNGPSVALPRTVSAALFVPHRHELVISDPIAKEIVMLSGLDSGKLAEATVTDAQASALAITKDGKILLALDSEHRKLLCVELAKGTTAQLSLGLPFDSLELLRDGRTFELSGGPEAPIGLVAFTSTNASPSLVMVPR